MWAFILSPIGRRILIGAAVLIVFAVVLKQYGNRQWEQGLREGKQTSAHDLEKAANSGRDQARAELQAARTQLNLDTSLITDKMKQLETFRVGLDDRLKTTTDVGTLVIKQEQQHVLETPDTDLPDLIRALNQRYQSGGPINTTTSTTTTSTGAN